MLSKVAERRPWLRSVRAVCAVNAVVLHMPGLGGPGRAPAARGRAVAMRVEPLAKAQGRSGGARGGQATRNPRPLESAAPERLRDRWKRAPEHPASRPCGRSARTCKVSSGRGGSIADATRRCIAPGRSWEPDERLLSRIEAAALGEVSCPRVRVVRSVRLPERWRSGTADCARRVSARAPGYVNQARREKRRPNLKFGGAATVAF